MALSSSRSQQFTGTKCLLQISSGSAVSGVCCRANLFLYTHHSFIGEKDMLYFAVDNLNLYELYRLVTNSSGVDAGASQGIDSAYLKK